MTSQPVPQPPAPLPSERWLREQQQPSTNGDHATIPPPDEPIPDDHDLADDARWQALMADEPSAGSGLSPTRTLPGEYQTEPLARRFAEDARQQFLFVHGIGWHEWDGSRWSKGEAAATNVQAWCADRIASELHTCIDQRADDAVIKRLTRYRDNTNHLADKLRLNPTITCLPSELDAAGDLLNCPNGVVNLTTGELRPSDKTMRFTKIAGIDYQPNATDPDWTAALEALPVEVVDYLQVKMGQAAYAEPNPDEVFTIFCGGGANGKSTILEAIALALGDFGRLLQDSLLMGTDHRERDHERTVLLGLRFGMMEELPDGKRLHPQKLKKIVGTDLLTGRFLHRDHFEFRATHTLFLSTNYLPQVTETDHGTWRRLELIEFPYKYSDDPQLPHERPLDQRLKHRVLNNKSCQRAVLAWIVEGAVRYHANGRKIPPPPDSITDAVAEWQANANPVAAYANQYLTASHNDHISTKAAFDHFEEWRDENGYHGHNIETFKSKLMAHFPGLPPSQRTRSKPTSTPPGTSEWDDHTGGRIVAIYGLRFVGENHDN